MNYWPFISIFFLKISTKIQITCYSGFPLNFLAFCHDSGFKNKWIVIICEESTSNETQSWSGTKLMKYVMLFVFLTSYKQKLKTRKFWDSPSAAITPKCVWGYACISFTHVETEVKRPYRPHEAGFSGVCKRSFSGPRVEKSENNISAASLLRPILYFLETLAS